MTCRNVTPARTKRKEKKRKQKTLRFSSYGQEEISEVHFETGRAWSPKERLRIVNREDVPFVLRLIGSCGSDPVHSQYSGVEEPALPFER